MPVLPLPLPPPVLAARGPQQGQDSRAEGAGDVMPATANRGQTGDAGAAAAAMLTAASWHRVPGCYPASRTGRRHSAPKIPCHRSVKVTTWAIRGERRHAAGPDSRALSLIARGVVGSIESHLFTPEDHCPQTLRTAGLPSGLSVRPGLTRPLCWRCIANMMAKCWVLTASHAGPVSARLLASRGVRSDRRDRGQPQPSPDPYSEAMMIRPVSRDGIHGPGFRCHGSPMCSSRVIISCPHGRRARLRSKARPSATVP